MRVVKKFAVANSVPLPAGSRILSLEGGALNVLCDPAADLIEARFRFLATGEEFDEAQLKCDYIGSYGDTHVVRLV